MIQFVDARSSFEALYQCNKENAHEVGFPGFHRRRFMWVEILINNAVDKRDAFAFISFVFIKG